MRMRREKKKERQLNNQITKPYEQKGQKYRKIKWRNGLHDNFMSHQKTKKKITIIE